MKRIMFASVRDPLRRRQSHTFCSTLKKNAKVSKKTMSVQKKKKRLRNLCECLVAKKQKFLNGSSHYRSAKVSQKARRKIWKK